MLIIELKTLLGEPIDGSPLFLFRAFVGFFLFSYYFFNRKLLIDYYTKASFYFYYEFSPFIKPRGNYWVRFHLYGLMIFSLFLGLGFFYRFSTIGLLYFLTSVFLWDKARYQNHVYLAVLIVFLFSVVDAGQEFSIDNVLWVNAANSKIPYWQLLIFQLQFLIVYTYAGINKLNKDWIVNAQPIKYLFSDFVGTTKWQFPPVQYCFNDTIKKYLATLFKKPATAHIFTWGGLLFDFSIIWLLLSESTIYFAIPFYILFHLFNRWYFFIDFFPSLNIAALVLFLKPEFSKKLIELVRF